MRKQSFAIGEYYHVYNRGVDKRDIFMDEEDLVRFFQSMKEFNNVHTIGSIYERVRLKEKKASEKLVDFICYCLNPNHYHFLLTPLVENGIEKFMHRLGTGYTKYFNEKYKRTGSLFGSSFKAKHIDSNEYLLRISAYINLNDRVHAFGSLASKKVRSSWREYAEDFCAGRASCCFCNKAIILDQFKDAEAYKRFTLDSLEDFINSKEMQKDLEE